MAGQNSRLLCRSAEEVPFYLAAVWRRGRSRYKLTITVGNKPNRSVGRLAAARRSGLALVAVSSSDSLESTIDWVARQLLRLGEERQLLFEL